MSSTSSILDFGRKDKPFRPIQESALKWFQENYDNHDVFVFEAPTATGKSIIVTTICSWLASAGECSASVITPTKMLQDQYLSDFDDIPVLKGMSEYPCDQMGLGDGTCRQTKKMTGNCCKAEEGMPALCNYLIARGQAEAASVALFNFHSYYACKMYKNVLVADEAHNAINFLYDFYHLKLWKCEIGYEDDIVLNAESIKTLIAKSIAILTEDLIRLESQHGSDNQIEAIEKEIERFGYIIDSISRFKDDLLIEKDMDYYKGSNKQCRGTQQEFIYVKPLNVDKIGVDLLWPSKVKKVVLLSATINDEDIKTLGLDKEKRVATYRCGSIIGKERRPFIVWPVASMSYRNRTQSIPKIAEAVRILAAKHATTKGIVHCTYETAKFFEKEFCSDSRFMFHNNMNKMQKYQEYLADKNPRVLIASGMDEGIDLADDAGRWQVITQLMRPNISDKVNKWMMTNRPRTYNWNAVRKVLQQTGRICRGPTDVGYTYMLDAEFWFFYQQTADMWPEYFAESIVWPKGGTS